MLFVAGLHRSGTSILHRHLGEHPAISGFANTGVPEDEGQHLQNVFRPALNFGGPGRFAFDPESALTEQDAAALGDEGYRRLVRQWGYHWDLSKQVLVEKSPPNLVRMRFLQAMFPNSHFLIVVRHPMAVAGATQKWAKDSFAEGIAHWCWAHARMLQDLPQIERTMLVRYEDYVADPQRMLARAHQWLGLDHVPVEEETADHNPKYFARIAPEEARLAQQVFGNGIPARFGYSFEGELVRGWNGIA